MKRSLTTACLYTLITAIGLGIIYPVVITGISKLLFRNLANGQLIARDGTIVGSRLIGQPFTGASYFHSRPSAAGTGYDAGASGGSNLGPSNKALIDRVKTSAEVEAEGTGEIPVDLVTASASGLDPDISPAAAMYQLPRIARERHLSPSAITQLVQANTQPRQLGLLGEPRVNVVQLNLALDHIR